MTSDPEKTEYVPTTEDIRGWWAERFTNGDVEFDAWLAAHDAEVRAAEREAGALALLETEPGEFEPTTAQVREAFILGSDEDGSGGDFDAWLARYEAQVLAARPDGGGVDLEGLKVAMLGTTDGDFIDPDSEVPAGEMFRLASDYLRSRLSPPTPEELVTRIVDVLMTTITDAGQSFSEEEAAAIAKSLLIRGAFSFTREGADR